MEETNKKQMENAFRLVMTTPPNKKIGINEVPKPDSKNTIHTPYRLMCK